MFYLIMHSTHFIYGYMAREETHCHHKGYSFWLVARVLLYAPFHKNDSTYHGLCYTSCGTLAGTRNSSMGPPWRIDPTIYRTINECSYHNFYPNQWHYTVMASNLHIQLMFWNRFHHGWTKSFYLFYMQ